MMYGNGNAMGVWKTWMLLISSSKKHKKRGGRGALWFEMAQKRPKPQKMNISKIFECYFFTFLGLNTHTEGVKKVCFRGPGWLDWTKVAFFGLKMHIFAIFRWFWVQKLQITNLSTFVRCLIAQFSIVTHIQNRIKNMFLLIPAH